MERLDLVKMFEGLEPIEAKELAKRITRAVRQTYQQYVEDQARSQNSGEGDRPAANRFGTSDRPG
jgi:hypothetical protein